MVADLLPPSLQSFFAVLFCVFCSLRFFACGARAVLAFGGGVGLDFEVVLVFLSCFRDFFRLVYLV